MIDKSFHPNITLEQARELIAKWQRKYDTAIQEKVFAQSVAFDMLFPDKKTTDLEEAKALSLYYFTEAKKAFEKRDKTTAILCEAQAEIALLKAQLRLFYKEG